jgi:hypothetical protein
MLLKWILMLLSLYLRICYVLLMCNYPTIAVQNYYSNCHMGKWAKE